jgi:predicted RNA-binding Zn-ribbon protein involved in translation (DUF1610 family)
MDNIETLTCNRCGASAPPNIEQGKPYKCENCGNTCVWPKQESGKILFQGDDRLCPNCGFDNPTERSVCRNCGEKLTKRCPVCNDEFYVGDNYCNNGHKYEKPKIIQAPAAPPQSNFAVATAAAAGMPVGFTKKCPNCGNTIPLEARLCQYCRQSFSDEGIASAKKRLEADLAQKQAEALATRLIKRGKTLRVWGAILAAIGVLVLAVFIAVQTAPASTTADNPEGFIGAIILCPTPLILAGGALFTWGFITLRKLQLQKENLKLIQTTGR